MAEISHLLAIGCAVIGQLRQRQTIQYRKTRAVAIIELLQNLTREELYERVWKELMTKLAKEFGLSDRGLAKICERNGISILPGFVGNRYVLITCDYRRGPQR
jgi:hypothetical protein